MDTKLLEEYIENTYEELADLGKSEPGKTFLARNRLTGKIVIKKYVPVQNGIVYEKIKSIEHRNLSRIYEVYNCDKNCIVIEEYISGETLEEQLSRLKVLPENTVYIYLVQILEALEQIHKEGIVHRDLTPSNIIVSTDNVIKLIDFGIARNEKENQTKDTTILGTVGYASPEQFGFCQTDGRTDIYAVGILLNVMLKGKLPNEQLTDNKRYREIIEKCTQIDPAKRYGSVKEIFQELRVSDRSIIPGFRSGKKGYNIAAVIGYSLTFLYMAGMLGECSGNIQAFFLEGISLILYLVIPFLLLSDFGRWSKNIKLFSGISSDLLIAIRIDISIVSLYCGILVENYARYTIMGLPKK